MMRHTGAFTAHGSDGRQYTVNVYIDYVSIGPPGGSAEFEGVQHLRLGDGRPVVRTGDGVYEVPGAGLTLRSAASGG
jgi:hypothetical protein